MTISIIGVTIHIRYCPECDTYKYIKDFHWNRKGLWRRTICKLCRNSIRSIARQEDKQKAMNFMISKSW